MSKGRCDRNLRRRRVCTLVDSLLAAIVREDGESLVLHVGERPIVVTARGPVEVASATMTLAGDGCPARRPALTPNRSRRSPSSAPSRRELPPSAVASGERFTVVAARGGDDIWIELRRRRGRRAASSARPKRPLAAPAQTVGHADGGGPNRARRHQSPRSCCRCRATRFAPDAAAPCRGMPRAGRPGSPPAARRRPRRRGALPRSRSRSPSIRVDGEIDRARRARPALGPQDVEVAPARGLARARRRGAGVGRRVDLRRARCRPRALPVVPRSPRARRHFPDDPGACAARPNSSGCRARFRACAPSPRASSW